MFSVKVVLNIDVGATFMEGLPADDPQTVIWMPEGGEALTVEKFVDTAAAAETVRGHWRSALAAQGQPDIGIAVAPVRETDWTTDWRSHFQLERVTDRLVVCPAWEPYRNQPGEWVVRVDPGMSFGTGQHGTTRSCLRFLARCRERHVGQPRFLDLGCGSGILSIAAALMGFTDVTAIDHDGQAVRDTRDNSKRNHVGDQVCALVTDLAQFRPVGTYDVVAANLLADVLVSHAATIAALVHRKPSGDLLVSGILREQYDAVRLTYAAQDFFEVEVMDDGEWRSGWLRRR